MNRVPIERKEKLTKDAFRREYLENGGKPVIVTDATKDWPAMAKWSFAYLRSTYGNDTVVPMIWEWLESSSTRVTKLASYIDHLDTPDERLRGFWIDPGTKLPTAEPPAPLPSPLYLVGWHSFRRHPELYADIEPAPYFIDDWVRDIGPKMQDAFEQAAQADYWDLVIGPKGSLSELHFDFWHTHSYLAQIHGRKRCILFAPTDSHRIHEGQVDPEKPDYDRFPLLAEATAHEAILEPGEVLFTPPDWWHHVRGLEKSLTVSHNFFGPTNVGLHLAEYIEAKVRGQARLNYR